MKERPIPFSAPMVSAILTSNKTQTRRLVKPQPVILAGELLRWKDDALTDDQMAARCPYGQPGDRLWVREAWRAMAEHDVRKPSDLWPGMPIVYEASRHPDTPFGKLRPGMFMPRWASRVSLEITGVRVERLQEISAGDAWAEGIPGVPPPGVYVERVDEFVRWSDGVMRDNPKTAYRELWESINGSGSWDENPWVWVVEFKVL